MRRQQHSFAASEVGREWAAKRENLPVFQVRDQLLAALRAGHMAVLSGDTGCGKTTQVPQYLLEQEIENGRGATCNIICTQPRRIAAMSVADRVAQERAEPPPGKRGSRVGCAPVLASVVLLSRLKFSRIVCLKIARIHLVFYWHIFVCIRGISCQTEPGCVPDRLQKHAAMHMCVMRSRL